MIPNVQSNTILVGFKAQQNPVSQLQGRLSATRVPITVEDKPHFLPLSALNKQKANVSSASPKGYITEERL